MSLCLEAVAEPTRLENALWRRLVYENDADCRDRLFDRYRDFALAVARGHFHSKPKHGLELADFEQLALVGLIESIMRYDPARGVPFTAYCRRRLRGAILDGLAESSEAGRHYAHKRRQESQRLASLKSADAVSGTDDYSRFEELIAGLAVGLILSEGSPSEEQVVDTRPNAYDSLEWRHRRRELHDWVDALPPVEALVIKRHYIDGLAFRAIAALTELSPGRISQIHGTAVARLRDMARKRR